jgi:hypothetical protein
LPPVRPRMLTRLFLETCSANVVIMLYYRGLKAGAFGVQ